MADEPLMDEATLSYQRELWRDYLKHRHEIEKNRANFVQAISLFVWRSLTLLNGGAIVALYTVAGHRNDFSDCGIRAAFACFAAGLVTTMLSAAAAFFAQDAFSMAAQRLGESSFAELLGDPELSQETSADAANALKKGNPPNIAAITLSFVALALFVVGCIAAIMTVTAPAEWQIVNP